MRVESVISLSHRGPMSLWDVKIETEDAPQLLMVIIKLPVLTATPGDDDDVHDLVGPRSKPFGVLGVPQRLRVILVVTCGLDDYEGVDRVVQLDQAAFKDVVLVVERKGVDDLRAGHLRPAL